MNAPKTTTFYFQLNLKADSLLISKAVLAGNYRYTNASKGNYKINMDWLLNSHVVHVSLKGIHMGSHLGRRWNDVM